MVKMRHFTLTGPYAGLPLCQCNKEQAKEKGDTFVHFMYCRNIGQPNDCPECLAIINDDSEEE